MLRPIEAQLSYRYQTRKRPSGLRRYLPRLIALGLAFLVIALLALASIGLIITLSPTTAREAAARHTSGVLMSMTEQGFILQEADGQDVAFLCGHTCQDTDAHLQRHLREHAHTDVYYVSTQEGKQHVLQVLSVD